jgi:hypothetical protein
MLNDTYVTTAILALGLLNAVSTSAQTTQGELMVPLFNKHGDEMKQCQVTSTETVNFAPGGIVRITGSYGDVSVEGWEQPKVEVTVIKSLSYGFNPADKQRLERVKVATDRHSDTELSISTSAPSANGFVHPFGGQGGGVALEYWIRVPRSSRLVIKHGVGMVSVTNVMGDIDASGGRGDLLVGLPGTGPYAIDARSNLGVVSSDFAGSPRLALYRMGERFDSLHATDATAGPHVRLRMGFGGITIKRLAPESESIALSAPK